MEQQSNFFAKCKSILEVKQTYKLLALQYHPEKGGDRVMYRKIQMDYKEITKNPLLNFDNHSPEEQADFINFQFIIGQVITWDVSIELIGNWIWIGGQTYNYRNELKKLGFKWSPNKHCWFLMPENKTNSQPRAKTMDYIRAKHGSDTVASKSSTDGNLVKVKVQS